MDKEGYTLFVDPKQSESRAVMAFMKVLGIDYKPMVYENGSHLKCPYFGRVNPLQTLPFLDGKASVAGAHTILRYLADAHLPEDNHYYPRNDFKKR